MGDAGFAVPEFRDLRLDQAAAMLSESDRQDNYDGMADRIRKGDNVESVPVVERV